MLTIMVLLLFCIVFYRSADPYGLLFDKRPSRCTILFRRSNVEPGEKR